MWKGFCESSKQPVHNTITFHLDSFSYAQNFYLLKIYLNLIEISNRVLKFEHCIKWPCIVQCACIRLNHIINLNTCTWPHSAGSIFKSKFQISNLNLRFQINSNRFSRGRSFGHKYPICFLIHISFVFMFHQIYCCTWTLVCPDLSFCK